MTRPKRALSRLPVLAWKRLLHSAAGLPYPMPLRALCGLRIAAASLRIHPRWHPVLEQMTALPENQRPVLDLKEAAFWRMDCLCTAPQTLLGRSWQGRLKWSNPEGPEAFRSGALVAFCHLHGQRLFAAVLGLHGIDAALLMNRRTHEPEERLIPRWMFREFVRQDRLLEAVRHVMTGGVLMVAIEALEGERKPVPTPHELIPSSSGLFRIARRTQRPVVPVVMAEPGPWHYEVIVGKPMDPPPADAPMTEAARFYGPLWNFFLPQIRRLPWQWSAYLAGLILPVWKRFGVDDPCGPGNREGS